MIANALLEGGSWSSIDAPTRRLLFRMLDDLEPEHLALLAFLADPRAWLSSHPRVNPAGDLAGVAREIIDSAESEILGDRYLKELHSEGLINSGYAVAVPISSMVEESNILSPVARALLRMVLNPADVSEF
jgi:hypothetical protein